jgi:hypothetical protein
MTFQGIFGHPKDMVLQAMKLTCEAIELMQPVQRIKFIHLNTVGVSHPDGSDPPRGVLEAVLVRILSAVLPPYTDSVRCAKYLWDSVGNHHSGIEWCVVRPDAFVDGSITKYSVHQQLQTRILCPGQTTKANIAHFMCDLALEPAVWQAWKHKMPTILDDK